MGLSFLYPLALAGLITAAVPLLIHLLNRRQQKRIRFPAVKFILLSQKRVARTYNLHNWLLLAVRTLAVILLVLLMAHPFFQSGVGLFARGAPVSSAIILDNSMSMDVADGGAAFARARQAARSILEALNDEDRALLIPTNPIGAEEPRFRHPEEAVLKAASLQATAGTADVVQALRTAYRMLRDTGGQKALWFVTDLGLNGWDRFSLAAVGEYDPTVPLRIVTVGPEQPPLNATIKSLETKQSAVATGLNLELTTTIVNFADTAIDDLPVRLTIGDELRAERRVSVPAGGEAQATFQFVLEQAGSHAGHVSLSREGMAGSQRYFFTVDTRERLNVLLVDGDPRRSLVDSETFFLSRALNPTEDLAHSVFLPEIIIGSAAADASPEVYQAVVLANLATVPERFAAGLARFVEQGGGILISLGDQIRAGDYNRKLWDAPAALLPGALGERQRVQLDQEVTIDGIDTDHPALGLFRNKLLADSLRSARVRSYFKLDPERGRVLLRLSNGDPLLVEQQLGQGRVLLWTSTADSEWNNAALKTAYLPLVQSLVEYLAGATEGSIDTGLFAGTAKSFLLPAAQAGKSVRVIDPRGNEQEVTVEAQANGAAATFEGNEFSGIYRVVPEDRGLRLASLYAVNGAPMESRIERIGQDELDRALGPIAHEVVPVEDLSRGGMRTDLSLGLVVFLVATLFFEGWLGQRPYE